MYAHFERIEKLIFHNSQAIVVVYSGHNGSFGTIGLLKIRGRWRSMEKWDEASRSWGIAMYFRIDWTSLMFQSEFIIIIIMYFQKCISLFIYKLFLYENKLSYVL